MPGQSFFDLGGEREKEVILTRSCTELGTDRKTILPNTNGDINAAAMVEIKRSCKTAKLRRATKPPLWIRWIIKLTNRRGRHANGR